MRVSLITVCYNAEKTIADAMASVGRQRTQVKVKGEGEQRIELEYIVVDGGSTDGTVEVIKKFEREGLGRGSRSTMEGLSFKWVSEKDRGMYDALNKGIRMATGDVIGILNADDVLAEDDVLERIVRLFECSDCSIDGCYGDIRFVKDLGGPTVRYCSGRWFRPWMFRFGTQTAHPSTFFRKECFTKWGDYSLDYVDKRKSRLGWGAVLPCLARVAGFEPATN